MADVDMTDNVAGYAHAGARAYQQVHNVIDFADTNLSGSDVAQLFHVENAFVHKAYLRVARAEGASATVDIGDDNDADGFLAAVDVNTAGNEAITELSVNSGPSVDRYTAGKWYGSEDTVDLTPSAALSNARIEVVLLVTFIEPYEVTTPRRLEFS